jgi:transcriptional regulator with XRE-family HTH domain
MDIPRQLRYARRRARLTQRQLADLSRVAQPVIARIESGRSMPRVDTLARLISACGMSVEIRPAPDVDRTAIRELLRLTPRERLDLGTVEARNLEGLIAR